MKGKRACLVINPHAGQNVARLTELIAVLSAAGWETEIAIKEYGGHSMELAARAAKANYDLVVGYGGDGTINQVLNGVMSARGCSSMIGVIPGGTANVWAAEIGLPNDPLKAALTLLNSEARKIDIGHVEVRGLTFADKLQDNGKQQKQKNGKQAGGRMAKASSKGKQHFLLMAGLGIDAAIMGHVSKPLKYRIGPLAVGLSAAEELPRQHPFPMEIRIRGEKHEQDTVWKGEALQVIIGNTRRYANIVQMTPDAYLDDGLLDVCVITAGNALTTLEEIASLLFRRKPDNVTAQHFHGASITISVPASIDLQLDGSAVSLKDYLSKSDRKALQNEDAQQVMITYRFDAMPRAVQVAIPGAYDGTLFEQPLAASLQHKNEDTTQHDTPVEVMQHEPPELIRTLLKQGHKVTVKEVALQLGKQDRYIIAGTVPHQMTGDTTPVAVRVDDSVIIFRHSGEQVAPALVQQLQEGVVIVAEGKRSKYGVIRATHVVI